MPRPPPPSGKFLPVEIKALRAVIDSLGDSKFSTRDPRSSVTRARAGSDEDFYERTYPVLYVLARHGIPKSALTSVFWSDFSPNEKRIRLQDGSSVLLSDEDVTDLLRVKNRYPNPVQMTKRMTGAYVDMWRLDARVMERWACRADLRRVPARYDDLVKGFSAIDARPFLRVTL